MKSLQHYFVSSKTAAPVTPPAAALTSATTAIVNNIRVIGNVFRARNKEGDFLWMIKSGNYEDCLFIFNDCEEDHHSCKVGGGNAVIRQFNKYSKGKVYSAGISTGNRFGNGGYSSLTDEVKVTIDKCFDEINELIQTGRYSTIYYSADSSGLLGMSIFNIHISVREYITDKLLSLAQ